MKSVSMIFLAVLCLISFQQWVCADTIEMLDGSKKTKVQVIEENLEKVIYKTPRLPNQSVPSDKVREVKFYASAADFKTAQEAYKNQDFLTAAGMFKEYADSLSDNKAALRAHCLYRVAECYHKSGKWKEAISAINIFTKTYPDHRLYPQAIKDRAICYLGSGDKRRATAEFESLKKDVSKKKMSEVWKYEVEYWLIFLDEKKSPKKALADYTALYKKVAEFYPEVANKARLRIGRVLIDQKKFDEALSFFTEIIDKRLEAAREVVAGAYLGRGLCTIRKRKPTNDDFKNALFDLLRVVVHYKEVGDHQAEAMYYAGKCFQQLGDEDSTKRWKSLYTRLVREWPNTAFGQKAANEIGG
ncbi:MAG: tetratricopeptide repeat protein [Planctomycetota bacterium]